MSRAFFSASFLLISLASTVSAQSGRKIEPMRTAVTESPAAAERAPEYSESIPYPKRPVRLFPSLRGAPEASGTARSGMSGAPPAASSAADSTDVIKVETDLITIPVSVFDRNGLYISGITKSEFTIFEDGEQQDIAYFGTTEKPFTVVLLLDTSPSTEYEIEEIQQAATAFVDQLKPQDKVAVIEFDGNTHVLTEATGDRQAIYKAIKRADFGGGTALYDAVDFSLAKRLNLIEGRKAIVLFTDGVDTASSKANYDTTLALAEESDTLVFPIYYNTYEKTARDADNVWGPPAPGTTAREYAVGKKYLEELAAYTGGRVFQPDSTPGGLTAAFEGIAEELRRQYNIGYIPKAEGKPGQRKQIKVRVNRPNLVLRARDSYVVGSK